MLLQPFLNEQWGPPRFSSVLYSANVCIMLQECSGFAAPPDGERWYNTQNKSKVYWEHKANISFEQILLYLCITFYNFTIEFNYQEH